VTSIGYAAFSGCKGLEKITIAEGAQLKTVGSFAFADCSSIKEIHIGRIEDWCRIKYADKSGVPFSSSKNANLYLEGKLLTEIELTEDITEIGDYCFSYCTSIRKFIIRCPITATRVFEGATGTLVLDTSTLGSFALSNAAFDELILEENATCNIPTSNDFGTFLSKITVSSTNPRYDSRENCNAIIETESNTLIQGSLITVVPNSVVGIGYYAFSGIGIESMVIPDSVTSIGDDAFAGCKVLQTVTLSKNIISIGSYAFFGCTALYSMNLKELNITTIRESTFRNSGLISINLPNSLTEIKQEAFMSCLGLTSIDIPVSVTSIGVNAFRRCESLASLTIPPSVTRIVDGLVCDCKSLLSLDIHAELLSINDDSLQGCVSLKRITCRKNTAPDLVGNSPFGNSTSNYTGRNTYNTGENTLYVPQGATGYDTGQWLDTLQNAEKCGFTISYTL
jgi:hypothetical protein